MNAILRAHLRLGSNQNVFLPRILFVSLTFFTIGFCFVANSNAGPITLTLANPTQFGTPGAMFTFSGTLTNLGPPVAPIRGSQISAPPPLLSPTFLLPNLDLEPGQSTGVIPFFSVTIDPLFRTNDPLIVDGFFSVNAASPFPFAFADYQVIVQRSPEPASLLLLAAGLLGTYAVCSRCSSSATTSSND